MGERAMVVSVAASRMDRPFIVCGDSLSAAIYGGTQNLCKSPETDAPVKNLRLRMVRPPPERPCRLFDRPNLVQGIAFEQFPVFHYVANACRILNVLQRILAQDHKVSQFSRFDTPQILRQANGFRTIQRRDRKSTRLNSSHGYISY